MPANTDDSYTFIENKINAMKDAYPSLRSKPNDYVFSALAVKANFYKNPALTITESDIDEMIVDGQYDGGVDVLLSDPNSDNSDLVIVQSKYHAAITLEEVVNAIIKMTLFYKDMLAGHFEQVNQKVQSRFLTLNAEVGDESKIHFVLYTSAPKSGIRKDRVEKKFREQFTDSSQFELSIYFSTDIENEIKESESRRPTVETGKIKIDKAHNILYYGDEESSAIVNVSAFSIKALYAQHSLNLLARNLRYHIAGREIDQAIASSIQNNPESFWLKNNGITIICDEFKVSGREVKLKNFSIVNGGQTTYMLHKSNLISEDHDLYLPCKIIEIEGNTEDEKNTFSLEIAKATNSQKAIKPTDLKANAPEQIRFAQSMREVGLFYQTKRGETVPNNYKTTYLNSSLNEVGKLCLAGIFQVPCISRTKPSSLFLPKYYDKIFGGNQLQISKLIKELLYIDFYFRNDFTKKYDNDNKDQPDANTRISFAHNARTICIAFVTLASRYHSGNITPSALQSVFNTINMSSGTEDIIYDAFKDITGVNSLLPESLFADKDKYDEALNRLFNLIIQCGITSFTMASQYDTSLNATNYLKKDKNYYSILKANWFGLEPQIRSIFDNLSV